jgi:iron complex outermembrane receptor protein
LSALAIRPIQIGPSLHTVGCACQISRKSRNAIKIVCKQSLAGRLALLPLLAVTLLRGAIALGADSQPTTQPAAASQATTTQPANARTVATSQAIGSDDIYNLSIDELMNVNITSVSKSSERIADAPAAVTLITQEDIQRSGLHEIPEILRLSPGVFVQHGNQLTTWSVSTRGFAQLFANKLEVLEDGRILYTPFFSGVYWDMVDYPIADLDRIEVIRGPGATLWGSNAVDGVINITSKGAQDTQGFLVDSDVGTDTSDLAVRYGGKIDDVTFYRVWAKGRDFADDPDANDQSDDGRGGFRIDRLATNKDTLTLQGDGSYQTISNSFVPGNPDPIPNYSHDYHSDEDVLARWTHTESDTNSLSLQVYYDHFQQRDPFVSYGLNTEDIDFQDRFAVNKQNELIWGLGGRFQSDVVSTVFLPDPLVNPSHRDTQEGSAFIQDTITLVPDQWTLFVGSKFEDYTYSGFTVQPNARLLWTPNSEQSFWGAFSRAVRDPARWEEDSDFLEPIPAATPTFVEVLGGGHSVKPEQMLAYEIGYRQQLGQSVSVDATSYVDDYTQLISITPLTPEGGGGVTILPERWVNAQSAQNYGGELAANWQVIPQWRLSGSYSFSEAFVQNDSGIDPSQAGVIQKSFPKNMFQIHSYMDLTPHVQFNASVYYNSAIGPSGVPVANGTGPGNPDVTRADFNITWNPKPGLDLSVGVQNAFDPQHYESTTGEGSTAEVRRAVYGQVIWKF